LLLTKVKVYDIVLDAECQICKIYVLVHGKPLKWTLYGLKSAQYLIPASKKILNIEVLFSI